MARPLDDPIDRLIAAALVGDGRRTLKQLADATGLSVSAVRVTSPTALEALIREIRRRAKVSTRTTVVLQTFFENRAHPVVGPDDKEPADRASPP